MCSLAECSTPGARTRPERPDQEGSAALQAHPEDVTGGQVRAVPEGRRSRRTTGCAATPAAPGCTSPATGAPGWDPSKCASHVTSCMQAHFKTPKHLTSLHSNPLATPKTQGAATPAASGVRFSCGGRPKILQGAASSPYKALKGWFEVMVWLSRCHQRTVRL